MASQAYRSIFDAMLGRRKPGTPTDTTAALKEFGELQRDKNYRIVKQKEAARYSGQRPNEYPAEQQSKLDRGRELEAIIATGPRAPNTDYQGIPTSPGGVLGRPQYITQDIREIAAGRDRFSILQTLDEIRMGRSTWSPAWRDKSHPMHGPVSEGFLLLIETLDDLDKQPR